MKAILCGSVALFLVLLAGCRSEDPAYTQLAQLQRPASPPQAEASDTPAAADPLASMWKEQKLIRDAQGTVAWWVVKKFVRRARPTEKASS